MLGGNHLTLPSIPSHTPLSAFPSPAIPRFPYFSILPFFFQFPFLTTAKFYDILYIQSKGKQAHTYSLRSVSPHRYLRSISWNFGGRRPPRCRLSTSWISTLRRTTSRKSAHTEALTADLSPTTARTPQGRSIYISSLL